MLNDVTVRLGRPQHSVTVMYVRTTSQDTTDHAKFRYLFMIFNSPATVMQIAQDDPLPFTIPPLGNEYQIGCSKTLLYFHHAESVSLPLLY